MKVLYSIHHSMSVDTFQCQKHDLLYTIFSQNQMVEITLKFNKKIMFVKVHTKNKEINKKSKAKIKTSHLTTL